MQACFIEIHQVFTKKKFDSSLTECTVTVNEMHNDFEIFCIFSQEMNPGITASCSSMLRIPSHPCDTTSSSGRSHRSAPTITFQESAAALPGNYV